MTRTGVWREFETGTAPFLRVLRFVVVLACIALLLYCGSLELTWPQQAVLGIVTVLIAVWMDRSSSSYLITLTLMMASCFSTFRYAYWRISTVVKFFLDPANTQWGLLDMFFILMLLMAEVYAFSILYLGYTQTLWPLRRTPVPLPDDPEEWPAIDLLIPTYNEPLSVVRYTALAAVNIDWPADKLNVYILDDGKREEFRLFAEESGIGYMTRDDNKHAKAGNINRALQRLDSPLVAIFDSDHVPTRSFLQVTVGWFLRDPALGMLQTPHHFYSPDPFERNLGQFRSIPNEGELFYGIVQDGNDFWNATFFCGSCAVLRRSALDEIGGIAVETVTEDAHTSLRMQMNGWNTAYINIAQAAGLATERLSGHVKQRIRWARGMIQIMRTDNPLFVKGLKPLQRLCYFNAMTHFLYGLPRLIFLFAPLIYLLFGHTNVPGYWAGILAYAFPHLVLSSMTNSRIQGQHRHSFWNEIYETVLAPYIFLPTTLALFNPKMGSFNVTAKGGVVSRRFFDHRIALPFLVMLGLNFVGLLCAIPRYLQIPHAPEGLGPITWLLDIPANMWDGTHPGTIAMNVIWTLFNTLILGVACGVAWESQQRRQTVRVTMQVPARVEMEDGTILEGVTADVSSGGVMLQMMDENAVVPGSSACILFPVLDGEAGIPATILRVNGTELRAQFDNLTIQEEEALTQVLYSRADTWLGWGESRDPDRPLRSLMRIMKLAVLGLRETSRGLMRRDRPANGSAAGSTRLVTSIAPVLLLLAMSPALLGILGGASISAQPVRASSTSAPLPGAAAPPSPGLQAGQTGRTMPSGQFDNVFTLADVGTPETIVLRGVDAYHSMYFSIPQTQVVKSATMRLRYHFSPGLLPALSHLKVSVNNTLFATLPVTTQPTMSSVPSDLTPEEKTAASQKLTFKRVNENGALLEATLEMPAEMLVHDNQITFEFVGHYTLQCEDPSHSTLWAHVDANSSIELQGSLLPLQDDLKLLPLPFYDAAVNLHPVIPIVFLNQPSNKALQAAGIVSSWFGLLPSDFRSVRFPVSFGQIPQGNVVLIAESAADLPPSLNLQSSGGPTVAMRTNPSDPYSKVLIVMGDSGDDLVNAARALALQRNMWQGSQVSVSFKALPKSLPDDAPRWLPTDTKDPVNIGRIMNTGDLQGDGSVPVGVYFRIPPDVINYAPANIPFHLEYRYNPVPLANESTLQFYANAAYVSSTPMPHSEKASAVLKTEIPIPSVNMRPFSNSLMLKFVFQIAKKNKCQDTAPLNLQGAVLKESYLDLRDIPHLAALPDLELFANAGYPFTRMKDLSETVAVLPDNPGADEIELFLTLMGHFGAQTGYPVTNVSVTGSDGLRGDGSRDYLVLGTPEDQPALNALSGRLPVQIQSSGLRVEDTQGFFAGLRNAWWKVRSSDHVQTGQLETSGGLPDALMEGIEWPKRSERSVVVIALRDRTVIPTFLTTFLRVAQTSDIGQSVSVLHGTQFSSYRIGNDNYHVGSLGVWTYLKLFFAKYPWAVVILVIVACILLATLLRVWLRRRARLRLQGED